MRLALGALTTALGELGCRSATVASKAVAYDGHARSRSAAEAAFLGPELSSSWEEGSGFPPSLKLEDFPKRMKVRIAGVLGSLRGYPVGRHEVNFRSRQTFQRGRWAER